MNNYEDQPCSLFLPKQQVESHPLHHQPRVVENLTPQKPPEEVPFAVKKKSCLSSANSRKELPAHPALHRKTVAFGRTVNVSQTVEATSRTAKKMASSSATSSPAQKMNGTENEDCQEDWKKVMKDELEAMKREMQEETAKRQEALNNQNLNKMQEMMSQFFQQIAVSKQPATEEKENVYEKRYQEKKPKPVNKVSIARQTIKKEGRIPPEAIPFLERRIQTDPIFRQQVDDVLADAEYDFQKDSYSPPPPTSEARYGGNSGANPAMMRETLTVERSIRYDNGLASLDSRQWTKERADGRNQDRWRNYEPEPILHSTYQPGNSVSYYPSAVDRAARNNRGRDGGYYVEHSSDQEDDVVEYEAPAPHAETPAERERRIREKYSRRK